MDCLFSNPFDSNKTEADTKREIKHTFSACVILHNLGPTSLIKYALDALSASHNGGKSMICTTGLWHADLIPVLHVIKARDESVKAVDAITKMHHSHLNPSNTVNSRIIRDLILLRYFLYIFYFSNCIISCLFLFAYSNVEKNRFTIMKKFVYLLSRYCADLDKLELVFIIY